MINLVRSFATKWYVAVSLSCTLLFFSCQSNELQTKKLDFTGEQLFRGIFFGEEEVVKYIPELQERNNLKKYLSGEDELSQFKMFQDDAIELINKKDPQFFARFKSGIQSGKHTDILREIKNGSSILIESVEVLYGVKESDFKNITSEIKDKTQVDEIILNGETLDKAKFDPILSSLVTGYLDSNNPSVNKAGKTQCVIIGPIAIVVAAVAVVVIALMWVMADEQQNIAAPNVLLNDQIIDSIASNLSV